MEPGILDSIRGVAKSIEAGLSPEHIILFSHKTGVAGKLISFKLCVVIDGGEREKTEAERRVYLEVDSEIPFDVVLYTSKEWRELLGIPHSFASSINETGYVFV